MNARRWATPFTTPGRRGDELLALRALSIPCIGTLPATLMDAMPRPLVPAPRARL